MVKKEMYRDIIKLKQKGYSKRQITGELNISKKTVSKYYNMTEEEFRRYQRGHLYKEKIFDIYEEEILEIYACNGNRKINMTAIYDYLEEKHSALPGLERSLRNFICYLIDCNKLQIDDNARVYEQVPELPPGKQMQLDFGEYKCTSGLKIYIFAALLSASRYKFVVFQDKPFKTKDVILHLLDCFDFFGGIITELVIDQDKLMVVSENKGDIIYTGDFQYFINEMEIQMRVCRAADPESKGKIENLVGYVKHNFFELRDFVDIDEANNSVKQWLSRRANGKISQATKIIPAIAIENERKHLQPVRNSIFRKDSLVGRDKRTVSDKGYVSVETCQYLLPAKYKKKDVEIYITKQKLFVFDIYTDQEIVEYDLSSIPGKTVSKREFKRESDVAIKVIKEKAEQLFQLANWTEFLKINFKQNSRYIRDQALDALKYFEGEKIYPEILDKALEFCIANKTFFVSNLNDTYKYYTQMYEESKDMFQPEDRKLVLESNNQHKQIDVKRRNFSVYKSIVKRRRRQLYEIL